MTGQNPGSFYSAEPESVSSTSSPSPHFRFKETTDEPEGSPTPPPGRSLSVSETSTDPGEPEKPSMEITAEEEDQQAPQSSDIPSRFEPMSAVTVNSAPPVGEITPAEPEAAASSTLEVHREAYDGEISFGMWRHPGYRGNRPPPLWNFARRL